MGADTFTGKLHEAATKAPESISIAVDGPYGYATIEPMFEYPSLVFIAGGVGVTPCAAALEAFLRGGDEVKTQKVVCRYRNGIPICVQCVLTRQCSHSFFYHFSLPMQGCGRTVTQACSPGLRRFCWRPPLIPASISDCTSPRWVQSHSYVLSSTNRYFLLLFTRQH
jgi:hypothetical protein